MWGAQSATPREAVERVAERDDPALCPFFVPDMDNPAVCAYDGQLFEAHTERARTRGPGMFG